MAQLNLFPLKSIVSPKWYIFKTLEIGKVHERLPLKELGECLPPQDENSKGAPRWLSNEGMFALMFLKHYLNLSDHQLIERFNTDWSLQIFCNRPLADGELIKDSNLPSRVRTHIAKYADLNQLQTVLLNHWKDDIENTHVLSMDATCYESCIRFPTDVKLLWESNQWVHEKLLFKLCKITGEKRPRNKFVEHVCKGTYFTKVKG